MSDKMKTGRVCIDAELCTGCGHCKEVCPVDAIGGVPGSPQKIDEERCVMCGQCIHVCASFGNGKRAGHDPLETQEPAFAAHYVGEVGQVLTALGQPHTLKVVQCAPAVRVALAEEFGLPFGSLTPGKLASALRAIGFDRVYDTNFAADVTIMEEGAELLFRLKAKENLPMFTSCCPAWVRYVEQAYPDLLGHLSSCKSPQQMAGALFKGHGADLNGVASNLVYSVAVMPCTCKAFEASRPEMESGGLRHVDHVITTRELARLIKHKGVEWGDLKETAFDAPFGEYTGAGNIFGNTGGVMEAALRTACESVTGKPLGEITFDAVRGGQGVRKATIVHEGLELTVAIVGGLAHVAPLLEAVRRGEADFDFLEVMCCPEGCISGGGQPKVLLPFNRPVALAQRKAALYAHDSELPVRKSHENPNIQKLYKEYLGEPLGHLSHELLHTDHVKKCGGVHE